MTELPAWPPGLLSEVTLGTHWREGERRFVFGTQNAAGAKQEINLGTLLAPDTGVSPAVSLARVHSVPESSFAGDGEGNLATLRVNSTVVAGGQGQAIAAAFGAETFSTYEGAKSLADAFGFTSVGASKAGSTRTGGGGYMSGRRESATGRTTGAQIVSDNETEESQAFTGTLPGTKGINLTAIGTAASAVGLVSTTSGTSSWHTLFGIVAGSVTNAVLADYGESKWSILIKKPHEEAAITVGKEAGPIVVGREKVRNAASLFEVYTEVSADPLYQLGTDKGVSVRGNIACNSTGNLGAFVAAANNAFLTGTVAGDSGLTCVAGHIMHFGASGKGSKLQVSETGVGFFGHAPAAQPTGVAETAAAIIAALKTIGIFG